MFFAAFQLVLLYMYGRSVIAVDMFLNLVTTNPEEAGELLGNIMPIVLAVIILYGLPIILAIVTVILHLRLSPKIRTITIRSGLFLTLMGTVCFSVSFTAHRHFNPLIDIFPINVWYNAYLAADRTKRTAEYPHTSEAFVFDTATETADTIPKIIVAVIGETSRADNWQLLGYPRPTTPELMGRSNLIAFPHAYSQSNTTHKSVPMLLSHLDASNFGDSIYYVKSFITAFKEAGYHTSFISNQNRNHSFIDRFGEEADECIFIRDLPQNKGRLCIDTDLLPYLDSALCNSHENKLIVLHTYGSHFSYADRYPASSAYFKPDAPAEAEPSHRPVLVNAYDNTIRLTSRILDSIMTRLSSTDTEAAMIYTSDHGEDIFDDSRHLFLHASPCPTYWQIHVPFLIWGNDRYCSSNPDKIDSARSNSHKFVASSQAYFHTVMELAGLHSPYVKPRLSVIGTKYTPDSPVYLNDHNRAVTWLESGLSTDDISHTKL